MDWFIIFLKVTKGENMPRRHRIDLVVIFAAPQQYSGPGTEYFAKDGTITPNKSEAAKFHFLALLI